MKSAWFDENKLPDSMLNANFPPLGESDHFSSLGKCLNEIEVSSVLDLGCGAAEASNIFTNQKYTGADLPHIIEKVAKKKNPGHDYVSFDANTSDFSFIKGYDVVLMNSFVSEIPNWYLVLSKILPHCQKYVIIHRQEVFDGKTSVEEYKTYGGLPTTKTIVNYTQLMNVFRMNEFKVLQENNSFPYDSLHKTFLLKRE
jgi:SAM-dependent methyltransferase